MCTVPALVLPWLFSCSWRKHVTILTAHQPSEAFLVECQWQPMCRQKWQMIIRLWSLKNQSSYMYKSFSTEHTEHHIITSQSQSQSQSQSSFGALFGITVYIHSRVKLTQYACAPSCTCNFSAARRRPPSPPPRITGESLLFQLWPFTVVSCSCSCTFSTVPRTLQPS